jgi:hypothetical protein
MIKSASKTLLTSRRLRRAGDVRPEALIALVKDASEQEANPVSTPALREHLAPLADWIEIDLAPLAPPQREDWLRNQLTNVLRLRQMHPRQLVILGSQTAACIALDLILKGMISCGGIVAVDLVCALPRNPILATSASIRIVLHDNRNDPARTELIDALRRQDADFRLMTLPFDDPEPRDITTRATAAFLSELTAKACRQSA